MFGNDFQRRGFDSAEQQAIVMVRDAPQLGLRCMVSPYEELPTIEATEILIGPRYDQQFKFCCPMSMLGDLFAYLQKRQVYLPHCVLVTKWRLSPFTCIRRQYER